MYLNVWLIMVLWRTELVDMHTDWVIYKTRVVVLSRSISDCSWHWGGIKSSTSLYYDCGRVSEGTQMLSNMSDMVFHAGMLSGYA